MWVMVSLAGEGAETEDAMLMNETYLKVLRARNGLHQTFPLSYLP
jgi:hypothetical protein